MSPFPTGILPMLAVSGTAFDSEEHTFEVKWDGVRAIAYKDGGRFWLETRNHKAALPRFPELAELPAALAARQAILDGEIVVFGADGRPDFDLVRARNAQKDPRAIALARNVAPALFIAFDCLFRDGTELMARPLCERREHLRDVVRPAPVIAAPEGVRGQGVAFFAATAAKGLEGMVAKDLRSPYLPGRRSPAWVKVRHVHGADCVVGGFVPKGTCHLKSLLLGLYDPAGALQYVGHVGTGFSEAENRTLRERLDELRSAQSPFAAVPRAAARGAVWTHPRLVCSVEFLTLTGQGHLRHPTYRGLRFDKDPATCLVDTELGGVRGARGHEPGQISGPAPGQAPGNAAGGAAASAATKR